MWYLTFQKVGEKANKNKLALMFKMTSEIIYLVIYIQKIAFACFAKLHLNLGAKGRAEEVQHDSHAQCCGSDAIS